MALGFLLLQCRGIYLARMTSFPRLFASDNRWLRQRVFGVAEEEPADTERFGAVSVGGVRATDVFMPRSHKKP
ncbi:hypothetical protein K814_0105595 [Pseudomonas fluorescens LMG 5329]|uniref:Uncharacterized protein n=1 Tax=Pseudomonas fluorescens LMG 5329 TaxID=1324332 RepID=A0A0A1Z804_PSEFL|nr:hypothetical protein K814_0105595 [Pseudomonas fluorescens LMG 5329]